MASRLSEVPRELWDRVLPQAEPCMRKVLDLYARCKFGPATRYKDVADVQSGELEGSKLRTVVGTVTVSGNILKAIGFDLRDETISPDMPKKERRGKLCRYIYYQDAAQEQYFKNTKELKEVRDAVFLYYNINEVDVPLVANREFVTLRIVKKLS